VLERAKTVRAFDRAATAIGKERNTGDFKLSVLLTLPKRVFDSCLRRSMLIKVYGSLPILQA
jgi:hypothetical protein